MIYTEWNDSMELKFKSEEELYNRLLPAIKTKKNEIKRMGINYILEEDIYNALKIRNWQYKTNLTLSDMVDDILNTDNTFFDAYIKKEVSKMHRDLKTDDNIL